MMRRPNIKIRITRDAVIFAVGIGGIVHETVNDGGERPTLILLFAAMIGLPAFLWKDDKKLPEDKTKEKAP